MIRKRVELSLEQDSSYFGGDTLQGLLDHALNTLYGQLGASLVTYELEDLGPRSAVVAAEGRDMVKIGAALALVGQYAVSRCKVKLSEVELSQ
jgi:hypothetical protein